VRCEKAFRNGTFKTKQYPIKIKNQKSKLAWPARIGGPGGGASEAAGQEATNRDDRKARQKGSVPPKKMAYLS